MIHRDPVPGTYARAMGFLRRCFARTRPWMYLAALMVLYAAGSFALSALRWQELDASTFDLGLYQQSLWSTSHGFPFYESADWEIAGFPTLLDVHTVFILYLLVPLYQLAPTAYLLFAVQSGAVAAGAVPLYLLGRDHIHDPRAGLLVGGMYLAWAPLLAANLYDFHPEAFLPVELFTLFWFWMRGRYAFGSIVAVVSFLTLEVAPVLVAAMAIYFVTEKWTPFGRLHATHKGPEGPEHPLDWEISVPRRLQRALGSPRVTASLVLLASSIVAYFLLREAQTEWLALWLHQPLAPSQTTGTLAGTSLSSLDLSLSAASAVFPQKVAYWLVLYALVGLIPWLAPRGFILAVPWWAYSLLALNPAVVTVGYQYSFIAAIPVFLGFVLGLGVFRRWYLEPSPPGKVETHPKLAWRGPGSRRILQSALLGLILLNLAMSPLDPLAQGSGPQGYAVSYVPPPGFSEVLQLSRLVPDEARVLATPRLFPLVANDLHAYSLLPPGASPAGGFPFFLPFNITNPPSWVFVSQQELGTVPSWLGGLLYNRSVYGVRGVVWSSALGTVMLFERSWTGPYLSLGPPPGVPQVFWGSGLSLGPAGRLAASPAGPYPETIFSIDGETGNVWFGPYTSLAPGNYTVEVDLIVGLVDPALLPPASDVVFQIQAGAFGQPTWYYQNFLLSQFNSSAESRVTFRIDVRAPSTNVQVVGYSLSPLVEEQLLDVSISPVAPTQAAPLPPGGTGR